MEETTTELEEKEYSATAGGGAVKAAAQKGNPVSIPANSRVDIILKQPITVNPSAYSYED